MPGVWLNRPISWQVILRMLNVLLRRQCRYAADRW